MYQRVCVDKLKSKEERPFKVLKKDVKLYKRLFCFRFWYSDYKNNKLHLNFLLNSAESLNSKFNPISR